MGRPPTRPDKKLVGFTVKMTKPQHAFLEALKDELDVQFGADVVREIVEAIRTWHGLPAYMVAELQRDMVSRDLHPLSYAQELLARRYEALSDEARAAPPGRQSSADRATKKAT